METSAVFLIAFVVLLIGISKSAFAGALGVFAVPLLMLKFSAVEAIALILPLLIIADVMTVRSFWKKWDAQLLRSLIPGALIGIVIANVMLDFANPDHLRVIIAIICIVFAIKSIWFKKVKLTFLKSRLGAYVMSASSGISSTMVHAGGPPLILYFSAIGLSQTKFVATAAAFFAIINIGKLIGAVSLGLLNSDVAFTALAFVPFAFIGNGIGVKITQRINKAVFLNIMNYLLLILGIWLLLT
ncbi:MAG: putative membrane protein YfcA [Yoonia sp.]|jgi:uncharacterized membrane protein YfcA